MQQLFDKEHKNPKKHITYDVAHIQMISEVDVNICNSSLCNCNNSPLHLLTQVL